MIDLRKLNEQSADHFLIPDTSVILFNLEKSKYITTLDLIGFHQIVLLEFVRHKIAFSVNNGKYEFCSLPYVFKKGPKYFSTRNR